eukprot:scaffold4750_cov212-Pinguiococcus_pyrenoidosus.AAC.2
MTLSCSEGHRRRKEAERRAQQLAEAVLYCRMHSVGARRAISDNPHWDTVSRSTLDRELSGKRSGARGEDKTVLTGPEEAQLVDWINQSALVNNAQKRRPIARKVIEILRQRARNNKRGGRKHVKFSKAARDALLKGTVGPSFFTRLFTKWADKIYWVKPHEEEGRRAEAACEESIELHFDGVRGLRQKLRDAGIMDEEGKITAPERVLNCDETPQFADFGCNRGNNQEKVAASRKKRRARQAVTQNRTCPTVDFVWGLDGFQYGPHLIVSRKTIDTGLIPTAEELGRLKYNDEIDERIMCSFFACVSTVEKGTQTTASFKRRIEMLDKELTARNISRPVVLCMDNHESHTGPEVEEFMLARKIVPHYEPPNTSAFLQALDQYNQMLHDKYRKEVRVIKDRRGEDYRITIHDFIMCVLRAWPFWSAPSDRVHSFYKVGISQGGIDPSTIDRSSFVMQTDSPAKGIMPKRPPSPVGARRGSLAYWKSKAEALEEYADALEDTPITPLETLLLEVEDGLGEQQRKKKKRKRLRAEHTTESIHVLQGEQAAVSAAAAAIPAVTKRKRRTQEELLAVWDACNPVCQCEKGPDGHPISCPAAGFSKCGTCGKVSRVVCKKPDCVAQAGPARSVQGGCAGGCPNEGPEVAPPSSLPALPYAQCLLFTPEFQQAMSAGSNSSTPIWPFSKNQKN